MSPSRSAREILAGLTPEIGTVPSANELYVCDYCLGPNMGYSMCFGCSRVFKTAPVVLQGMAVPMSTASNPSPWYGRLVRYKGGQEGDHTALTALVIVYLRVHNERLEQLLGGSMTSIVVVPSSRGRDHETHPLAKIIRRSEDLRAYLKEGLRFVPGQIIRHQEYNPAAFMVNLPDVAKERVVLLEDLWVSGAKAVSAAGALLETGVRSVAILSIARELRPESGYCPEEYLAKARAPYDVAAWPR